MKTDNRLLPVLFLIVLSLGACAHGYVIAPAEVERLHAGALMPAKAAKMEHGHPWVSYASSQSSVFYFSPTTIEHLPNSTVTVWLHIEDRADGRRSRNFRVALDCLESRAAALRADSTVFDLLPWRQYSAGSGFALLAARACTPLPAPGVDIY